MKEYRFRTPLKEEDVRCLQVGDVVYLSGTIHTSRDMAHLKYKTLIKEGQPLPRNFAGSVIFHAGPVCLKQSDGSWKLSLIGPTTSIRMEPYADMVGQMGVKAIIGKGGMGRSTCDACQTYGYVYLQAAPGCAAEGRERRGNLSPDMLRRSCRKLRKKPGRGARQAKLAAGRAKPGQAACGRRRRAPV